MQFILGIIAEIISFLLCIFPNTAVTDIRQNLDIKIKPYQIEFHEDAKGWFGDGEELIIFCPTAEQIEKIKAEWQKTPVNSGIAPLIFEYSEYNSLVLKEKIPKSDGYWIFKNRGNFTNGYAFNFSFALFDGEKVYYYELDT